MRIEFKDCVTIGSQSFDGGNSLPKAPIVNADYHLMLGYPFAPQKTKDDQVS
jgi:hypothetical protein